MLSVTCLPEFAKSAVNRDAPRGVKKVVSNIDAIKNSVEKALVLINKMKKPSPMSQKMKTI